MERSGEKEVLILYFNNFRTEEENTSLDEVNNVQVFSCPDCSEKFVEEKNLALHLRVYNGVKHFSCSQCVRSFAQQKNLKTHVSIHDGEKP
jgi:uncharacterized Zn-finger protein